MCSRFPTPAYTLSYIHVQFYPPLRQLHYDFGDFSKGVCLVKKIAKADSNPDRGLSTGQTFRFSTNVEAGATEMPIMTTSVASDSSFGQCLLLVQLAGWQGGAGILTLQFSLTPSM